MTSTVKLFWIVFKSKGREESQSGTVHDIRREANVMNMSWSGHAPKIKAMAKTLDDDKYNAVASY